MFEGDKMALDFGAYSIKAAIGRAKGGKVFLRNLFELPLPQPTDFLNADSFERSLEVLRAGLSKMGIKPKGKEVYLSLDPSLALTRRLVLPYVKEPELTPMVTYEIENYLSSLPENNEIRFYIEEVYEDAYDGVTKMKIFVAVLPKPLVEMTYDGLKSMGFVPVGMDLTSNCVHRVYSAGTKMNGDVNYKKIETCVFMDIGHKKLGVDVLYKDYLDLNRVMNYGGNDLDRVIVDMFQSSPEEVFYKKVNALNLETGAHLAEAEMEDVIIFDISKDIVDNWITQLQKVIRYYTSKDIGRPIEHIFLHGGSSGIKGLEEYMAQSTGLPVTKVSSFANINFHKYIANSEISKYLNVIGALLHKGGGRRV